MPNLIELIMDRYGVEEEPAKRIEKQAMSYCTRADEWPLLPPEVVMPCLDSAAIDYCMWINDNTTVH